MAPDLSTLVVEVYTRSSCSLCDEALDLLQEARRARGFTLVERNIFDRADWFSCYRYRVPVVCIDGIERLALRFSQQELEAALKEGTR